MAKFYGNIGFGTEVEEPVGSGNWVLDVVVRPYYGDVHKNSRRLQSIGQLNDDITITNEISIIADQFAYEHFSTIRYVEFMGTKWKISNATVEHPRLILTLGGVYNG
jgi:hypothetical protein